MTLIIVIGILAFFLGLLAGCVSSTSAKSWPDCPHWDYDLKSARLSAAETRIYQIEEDIRRNLRWSSYVPYYHHACGCYLSFKGEKCQCEPKIYAKTVDEQELVDLIQKSQKTAKQLVKDLNFNPN